MQQLILMIHAYSIALIVLILVQHGKGADVGATFGSGASNTMFGSGGSTPFLVKVTGSLAALFFVTSLSLTYVVSAKRQDSVVITPIEQSVPSNGGAPVKAGGAKKPAKDATPN